MADPLDPCTLLAQARKARHDFLTGKSISEFRDQNGESVKYRNFASLSDIDQYIRDLDAECNPGSVRASRPRAIGFIF